ncbi:MAG: TetR/AcrR family transcriptional regulator [Polyangiales bacterium]
MKTKHKGTPRPGLTKLRVIEAAVSVADANGLDALSMRRLGQELGVEAMSLYKHIANKEDLLDGIVDHVAGEIALPPIGGDWKQAMRRRATSAHRVLLRHPWATLLFVSRPNVGPAMLRYIDATLGCLHAAGFSYPLADHAWNAIDSHVYGSTLLELNFPFRPDEYASAAAHFLPMLPPEQYPHMRALSQLVIAGEHDGRHDFELGITLILDGLERLRVSERRA